MPVPDPAVLDPAERDAQLAGLPAWSLSADGAAIRRVYDFADFGAAFAFMAEMALYAEKAGHHPDWANTYARVVVGLTTHDAGGLTRRDLDWARRAEAVYARGSSAGRAG